MFRSWFGPVGEETNPLLLSGIKPRVLRKVQLVGIISVPTALSRLPLLLIVGGRLVRFGAEHGLATTSHSPEIRLNRFDISEAYTVTLQFSISSTRWHKICSRRQAEFPTRWRLLEILRKVLGFCSFSLWL